MLRCPPHWTSSLENGWMDGWMIQPHLLANTWIHSAQSSQCILGVLYHLSVHCFYTHYCITLWDQMGALNNIYSGFGHHHNSCPVFGAIETPLLSSLPSGVHSSPAMVYTYLAVPSFISSLIFSVFFCILICKLIVWISENFVGVS